MSPVNNQPTGEPDTPTQAGEKQVGPGEPTKEPYKVTSVVLWHTGSSMVAIIATVLAGGAVNFIGTLLLESTKQGKWINELLSVMPIITTFVSLSLGLIVIVQSALILYRSQQKERQSLIDELGRAEPLLLREIKKGVTEIVFEAQNGK